MVFLNFGCAWLNDGFAVEVVWTLWRIPSLFRMSTVAPAGNASTCGLYSQFFWSNVGFDAGGVSFFPFWMSESRTTTFWMPLLEPTRRSGEVFSLPHTSL